MPCLNWRSMVSSISLCLTCTQDRNAAVLHLAGLAFAVCSLHSSPSHHIEMYPQSSSALEASVGGLLVVAYCAKLEDKIPLIQAPVRSHALALVVRLASALLCLQLHGSVARL